MTPLNFTTFNDGVELNPVPLIKTSVPGGPFTGENELIVTGVHGPHTLNGSLLVPVMPSLVTVIGPDVAPCGTMNLSVVSLTPVATAVVPLTFTT